MADLHQLKILQDLAESKVKAALNDLARARKSVDAAQQQLDTLNNYRADYHRRLKQQTIDGITSDVMRNFQEFMGNVDRAIAQQQVELDGRRAQARVAESRWQQAHQAVESFRVLQGRAQAEVQQRAQVRERRGEDEFASRSARRASQSTSPSDWEP